MKDFYINWGLTVRIEEAAEGAKCPRCGGYLYTLVSISGGTALCAACAQTVLEEAVQALGLIT